MHKRSRTTKLDRKINSIAEPDSRHLGQDNSGRDLYWQPSALTTTLNRTTTRKFLTLDSEIRNSKEAHDAYLRIEKYLSGIKFRVRKAPATGMVRPATSEEKMFAVRACLKVIAGCCLSGKAKTRHWVLWADSSYFESWLQSSGFIRMTRAEIRTVHEHALRAVEVSGLASPSGKRQADKVIRGKQDGSSIGPRSKDYSIISRIKYAGAPCGIRIDIGKEQSFFAAVGQASRDSFITATTSSEQYEVEHGIKIMVPESALGHGAMFESGGFRFHVRSKGEGRRTQAVESSSGAVFEAVDRSPDGMYTLRMVQPGRLVRADYDFKKVPSEKDVFNTFPVRRSTLKRLGSISGRITVLNSGSNIGRPSIASMGVSSCISAFDPSLKTPVEDIEWQKNLIADKDEQAIANSSDHRKIRDVFTNPYSGKDRAKERLYASTYLFMSVKERPVYLDPEDTSALDNYNRENPEQQISCITIHSNNAVTAKLTFKNVAKDIYPPENIKTMIEECLGVKVSRNVHMYGNHSAHVPQDGAVHIKADIDTLTDVEGKRGQLYTHTEVNGVLGFTAESQVWGL